MSALWRNCLYECLTLLQDKGGCQGLQSCLSSPTVHSVFRPHFQGKEDVKMVPLGITPCSVSVPSFNAASQGSFSWSSPRLTNTLSAALPSIYNCFTQAQCCSQLAELSPKHLKKQESCCFEKLLLEIGACHPFISYFHIL